MRTNIMALRQRKADLLKSAKAIHEAARKDNRDLTEGEEQNHYKLLKALESLERDIIAEKGRLAYGSEGIPMPDENSLFAAAALGQPIPDNPLSPRKKTFGRVGVTSWADIFGQPRSSGGFNSFNEYLHAVRVSGEMFDPRLQQAMVEDNPSQAGFLVPEQWAAFVLQRAIESSICMSRCQVWPITGSNVLKVPGVRDPDHSSGTLFGGIQKIWYDENAGLDDQNITTSLIQLTAHKLGMLSSGSSELAEDSANFESVLTASLQAAAQFFLDKAYLFGEGTGKPLGMLDPGNPALVVVNKNANTPSGSIILEDVLAMYAAQAPACRLRAEWIFTDELIPALYQMQVRVSNKANTDYVGGSATSVFVPDGQGGGTLLGRRVNFSEKMRAAGLQGDAAFICFDQYAIGIRRELQLRRSLEAGFKQDQIFWRLTTRVDGQSTWESKMKLQNGNVTSPFVVLQAR